MHFDFAFVNVQARIYEQFVKKMEIKVVVCY